MSPRRAVPSPTFERVYWDSCLFIAWLTAEQRVKDDLDGLEECVRHAELNLVTVIVSKVFELEVIVDAMPDSTQSQLRRFLRQTNVEVVDYEPGIVALAREIRAHYVTRKQAGTFGWVPAIADSIHLATAVNRKAEVFLTFDKGGKDKGNLLALDGDVAGHQLRVLPPRAKQMTLDLAVPLNPSRLPR